jgi:predicted dehydrogenase
MHILGFRECEDVEITAFCQRTKSKAESIGNEFHIPNVFTDYHDLLDFKELDAVSIVTPTYTHHTIALEAIDLGKHVLCDKPLAMDILEAEDMYNRAEKAGIHHMTGFEFRYVPAVMHMKNLIEAGYVGQILQVHVRGFGYHSLDPNTPLTWRHQIEKSPAGILSNIGIHEIDTIRWMIGEFKSVCGYIKTFVRERPLFNGSGIGKVTTEDECGFLAELQGGISAVIHSSGVASREHSVEIYGTKGALKYILERQTPNWILGSLFGSQDPHRAFEPIVLPLNLTRELKTSNMTLAFGNFLFANICRNFVRGIQSGKLIPPSFLDGLEAQRILATILRSAKERRWIDIAQ